MRKKKSGALWKRTIDTAEKLVNATGDLQVGRQRFGLPATELGVQNEEIEL